MTRERKEKEEQTPKDEKELTKRVVVERAAAEPGWGGGTREM